MKSSKRKFPYYGVLVILLIALVAFSAELFGCAREAEPGGSGSSGGGSGSGGSSAAAMGGSADGVEDTGPPVAVAEWDFPIVASITGGDSARGLAAAWGFDQGIKAVNEQGGIRGVNAKITVRDAASSESKTISETGSVMQSALVLLGPASEKLYIAAEQSFYSAKLPTIGAALGKENRESFKPFAISCVSDSGALSVSVVEAWAAAEDMTKVCVLFAPENAARTEAVKTALVAAGKTVTGSVELSSEGFEAADIAGRILNSGADAYYIDVSGADALLVIGQLRAMSGINAGKLKILCGPQIADAAVADAAEGGGDMLGVSLWTAFDPAANAEKRKAFDEAFDKHVGDPECYDIAVDYYQAAFMLKQAIEALGLTGAPDSLASEREALAGYLYDMDAVSTWHGDFAVEAGNKKTVAKIYKVSEDGLIS